MLAVPRRTAGGPPRYRQHQLSAADRGDARWVDKNALENALEMALAAVVQGAADETAVPSPSALSSARSQWRRPRRR